MLQLDNIIWLLRDGKWHTVREVYDHSSSSRIKTIITINFLREFGFVKTKGNNEQVKLSPSMINFVNKLENIEKGKNLGYQAF